MAKKKPPVKSKLVKPNSKSSAKRPAHPAAPKKKALAKPVPAKVNRPKSPPAKPAAKATPAQTAPASKPAAGKSAVAKPSVAQLAEAAAAAGRPQISGDEPLYMLFKEDFEARQIFEFLHVQTVRELEMHAARDIVRRLSRPVIESVERIRQRLAEKNRCLTGDEEYLREFRAAKK
jgi:outer membrane biosynthesis protein TonB